MQKFLIAGDFNENALNKSQISQHLCTKGFTQHVNKPTHIDGGAIDHVYTRNICELTWRTNSTYYSDHFWVNFVIQC